MMHRYPRILLLTTLLMLRPALSAAQQTMPDPSPTSVTQEVVSDMAPRLGPTDPAELEAFLDGVMGVLLEQFRVAGAVVSVVSGGEVLFAKGYGYADWEARDPVDSQTTLLRIGSVSKLFVWTSVMQLYEQGLIDLDADVTQYLDFELPGDFEEPVTLSDIMAHAGGFEDYVIGLFGTEADDVRPLGEILAEQTPARVRPPGDISSYSNHATGMAAYAVERASGTEWVEFVERNITDPLGMAYTTFRQPLPDDLSPHMSKGYDFQGGRYIEKDFEYVPLAPVGAAAASAMDMARFMIAHLQLGALGESRILSEETARLMQSDHHRMDPEVNAMAHGFMVSSRNGVRIIGHGGDTRWFHTGLELFPEHDLGVFVSFNSRQGGAARGRFQRAFVDHYFPVEDGRAEAPEDFRDRAARFTGEYAANRFSHTTITKLGRGSVSVNATSRGTLSVLGAHWIEVEPLVFEEEAGPRTLIFREEDDGRISHFFLRGSPIIAWERVAVGESSVLHNTLLAFAILTMALVLLSPLIGWTTRRWHAVPASSVVRIPGAARLTLWFAAALLAVGSVAIVFVMESGNIAGSTVLGVALSVPILAILPTLGAVIFAALMWMRRQGRPTVRVFYSAAALVLCLFLWQMSVWNVLGWHY